MESTQKLLPTSIIEEIDKQISLFESMMNAASLQRQAVEKDPDLKIRERVSRIYDIDKYLRCVGMTFSHLKELRQVAQNTAASVEDFWNGLEPNL